MEKSLNIYRANFDYEYQLYGLNSAPVSDFSKNLECLYFFSENTSAELLTQNQYSEEYLNYVAETTGRFPTITRTGPAQFWWGSLTDIELERKLNSKITSTQFAIENNLAHDQTRIIKSVDEVACSSSSLTMVLKDPHQMAGRGFFQFDQSKIGQAQKWAAGKFPLIQEPWLKKNHDIGTYCFANGEMISYLNFSNQQGNYKGTRIWADPVDQLSELKSLNLDLFLENMTKIRDYYRAIGATDGFSIDSFTYEDHCYYLSEVNYRKTMGWTAYQMRKFLQQQKVGSLIIHKRQKIYKTVKELLALINHPDIILISPPENSFLLFFLRGNDKSDLLSLERVISSL